MIPMLSPLRCCYAMSLSVIYVTFLIITYEYGSFTLFINLCSYLLCFHNCSNTQGSKDTNSLSCTIPNICILLLKVACEQ